MDEVDRSHNPRSCDFGVIIAFLFGVSSAERVDIAIRN